MLRRPEIMRHQATGITESMKENLTKLFFDDLVVHDWNTLPLDFRVTALENQIVNALHVRISPRDVWLDDAQHVDGSLVQFDKDAVVDLAQTQQLKDLANTRMKTIDTETETDRLI